MEGPIITPFVATLVVVLMILNLAELAHLNWGWLLFGGAVSLFIAACADVLFRALS